MLDPLKLALFIDAQNTYRGARESFFRNDSPSVNGQFGPAKLGKLIESRGGPNKQPKTYAAHMKQCAKWQADGVTVVHRQLRFPHGWPNQRAEEKGIDTALAVDFVAMAVDGAYDTGVMVSTDTDLLPALEFTHNRYPGSRHAVVAAWRSSGSNRRLSIPGLNIWCHWLYQSDYDAVADPTDYNR